MKVTTDSCIFGAWVVERLNQHPPTENLLDIGAGTGLLTLMITQAHAAIPITAVEIDKHASEQARENIARTPWRSRIQILNDDIKTFSAAGPFEVIVSNPPFYEQDLTGPDPLKNQAHHDSSLPFSELIRQLDRLLTPNGKFYILLPAKGMEERLTALRASGFFIHQQTPLHHSGNHPQMRSFIAGGRWPAEQTRVEQIFIHDASGDYSERMRELLQDYYLAF